jgi:hypothetical protein
LANLRGIKRLMPDFDPPWSIADVSVREEYAGGMWAYAIGKPAWRHKKYKQAVKIFEKDGCNPWWIRTYNDVEAVLDGCYFSEDLAQWVVDYFEDHLVHI